MHHINNWMCQNKLSLNYSKTTYLLFNKHLPTSINTNFKVLINNNQIDNENNVPPAQLQKTPLNRKGTLAAVPIC